MNKLSPEIEQFVINQRRNHKSNIASEVSSDGFDSYKLSWVNPETDYWVDTYMSLDNKALAEIDSDGTILIKHEKATLAEFENFLRSLYTSPKEYFVEELKTILTRNHSLG